MNIPFNPKNFTVITGPRRSAKMKFLLHKLQKQRRIFVITSASKYDPANIAHAEREIAYYGEAIYVLEDFQHYIEDPNDETQAAVLTSWLMEMANRYNIHIIVVVTSISPTSPRGHIGSQLLNKSELAVSVELEDGKMTVRGDGSRDRNFESLIYLFDEQGQPYLQQKKA